MLTPLRRRLARLPSPWRVAIDWLATILGAVAIVLAIKAWVVNPYRIPSASMEPTLHCARPASDCLARFSDRVLANRLLSHFRGPHRGEIWVFKTPPRAARACDSGGTFVKRAVALPGETWSMKDGTLFIDGERLEEPYVKPDRRGSDTVSRRKVPPGEYVMLGDNRSHSCDSRVWGPVPRANFIGKVAAVYWPPNRIALGP